MTVDARSENDPDRLREERNEARLEALTLRGILRANGIDLYEGEVPPAEKKVPYVISIEPTTDEKWRWSITKNARLQQPHKSYSGLSVQDRDLSDGVAGTRDEAQHMAEWACREYERRLAVNAAFRAKLDRDRKVYDFEV